MRSRSGTANRHVGPRLALACGLAVLAGGSAPAGGQGLMYYEDGGRVVITNTPSRDDVRPFPGLDIPVVWATTEMPETPYDPFIERVASEYGVSPALIKAVALVESGFDTHAVSPKGARGLMQLMPGTARELGVRDAFDPLENLRAGTRYLAGLLEEFDGDLTLALAAYNAGAGAVRRHGGVPDYRETREYVRKVHDRMGQQPRRDGGAASHARPAPPIRLVRDADGSIKYVN